MNPRILLRLPLPPSASASASTPTLTSASTSASASTTQENEITTLIPDKETLFSDLKAFTSHHEMTTALEGKKLKEKEQELEKATMEIAKLNTEIANWKNVAENLQKENANLKQIVREIDITITDLKYQVKGAAFLWKENEELLKFNNDLTHNLQTTAAKNGKLETSLKEKDDKISRLEQDVQKLSEYKQKVELATQIFRSPIRNVRINHQNNETNFAICGPLNEESTNGNGNENENGAGKLDSSTSEQQSRTSLRGANTAKRGRRY